MTATSATEPGVASRTLEFRLAGPWARYLARSIDMAWPSWLLARMIIWLEPDVYTYQDVTAGGVNFHALAVLLVLAVTSGFLAILIDAGIQAGFGNSIGKALMGIGVEMVDGTRPGLHVLLRRAVAIFVHGFWICLPLLSVVVPLRWWLKLKEGGLTSWDQRLDTRVTGAPLRWRYVIALVLLLAPGCPLRTGGETTQSLGASRPDGMQPR